jgi:hypothetical protein
VVAELGRYWLPKFSPHSFACIAGRGPHKAIATLQRQIRSLSRGGRRDVWALQLDVASFFATIWRPIIHNLVIPPVHNPNLRWLTSSILAHCPRATAISISPPASYELLSAEKRWSAFPYASGLPIGNLTSQFFANVSLTALDHHIARELKPHAYIRYMDDLTILGTSAADLLHLENVIDRWLQTNRRQKLNRGKTTLRNLREGISYLGYDLRQTNVPSEPLQLFLPKRKKWELVARARRLQNRHMQPAEVLDPLYALSSIRAAQTEVASINSQLGYASHARTYNLRKSLLTKLIQCRRMRFSSDFSSVQPF